MSVCDSSTPPQPQRSGPRPWLWAAMVGLALLLLAGILVTVILLSARLRQAERKTEVQTVPVGTQPGASSPATPASTPATSAPAEATAAPDAEVAGYREKHESGSAGPAPGTPKPVRAIEKLVVVVQKPAPTKVIEREKQVQVVEKPAPGGTSASEEGNTRLAAGTFRDTGLPNQLNYNDQRWNASERVRGLPIDLLIGETEKAEGRTVYHDHNAQPPYAHVYLQVPGERDLHVRYVPTAR